MYLSLNGRVLVTNEDLTITDIGEGDRALFCFTDLSQCCVDESRGQWLFPDGTTIPLDSTQDKLDFSIERGSGFVRLNRKNNATSPSGMFCCEVPDATSSLIQICININPVGGTLCQSHLLLWNELKGLC